MHFYSVRILSLPPTALEVALHEIPSIDPLGSAFRCLPHPDQGGVNAPLGVTGVNTYKALEQSRTYGMFSICVNDHRLHNHMRKGCTKQPMGNGIAQN